VASGDDAAEVPDVRDEDEAAVSELLLPDGLRSEEAGEGGRWLGNYRGGVGGPVGRGDRANSLRAVDVTPGEELGVLGVQPLAGAKTLGGNGGSRDSWCTPQWLARLIGEVDLDPCSNERSHIDAKLTCVYELDDNGLLDDLDAPGWFSCAGSLIAAPGAWRVYVNPPYSRGQVLRWVRHYKHTRFIFLLRWDPSTEWFSELIGATTHVWFPDRRINFEPPPGVKSSSNPFPHALYLRDPEPVLLTRLRDTGYTFRLDN